MNILYKLHFALLIFLTTVLGSIVPSLQAHDMSKLDLPEKVWKLNSGKSVSGHYYVTKENRLLLEKNDGTIFSVPRTQLTETDQRWVEQREREIQKINLQIQQKPIQNPSGFGTKYSHVSNPYLRWLLVCLMLIVIVLSIKPLRKEAFVLRFAAPILASLSLILCGFSLKTLKKSSFDTRVSFMDSSFSYFKPDINTRSDATWYYVESLGLPDHETMLGITAWQQQVPIPQCYIGNNAWSIPLHPQIAANPVPVNTKHFLRGAIAIAVNGIAIFSPYTNTGVDAFLDGQLDQFGGHSGRADDYHYHIAPTVLYSKVPKTSPLAFALDGFAIYGNIEPDGNTQLPLDSNHGHYGKEGSYHYHMSSSAPYMIKNMVGKVTEDSTMQIIPQAAAKGCRPALTPLKGATITHNIPYPTKNGFVLTYTVNGNQDTVDYSWTPQGNYTYVFKTPTSKTTSNYKGNSICTVPQANTFKLSTPVFTVFASSEKVLVLHAEESIRSRCESWRILGSDGKILMHGNSWSNTIAVPRLTAGTYWFVLTTTGRFYTSKFLLID